MMISCKVGVSLFSNGGAFGPPKGVLDRSLGRQQAGWMRNSFPQGGKEGAPWRLVSAQHNGYRITELVTKVRLVELLTRSSERHPVPGTCTEGGLRKDSLIRTLGHRGLSSTS